MSNELTNRLRTVGRKIRGALTHHVSIFAITITLGGGYFLIIEPTADGGVKGTVQKGVTR